MLIALPESNIRDYKVGQSVQVELWNRPGQLLPGTLREIAPAADAQARTLRPLSFGVARMNALRTQSPRWPSLSNTC